MIGIAATLRTLGSQGRKAVSRAQGSQGRLSKVEVRQAVEDDAGIGEGTLG